MTGMGAQRDTIHDAIVIVPGIMGTALKERDSGRLLWGLAKARWYVDAWVKGTGGLDRLALSPQELEQIGTGTYDPDTARIQPGGLLRFPSMAPVLRGFEPYTDLVREMKRLAVDDVAVLEFGYDWRLPTQLNSVLLRRAITEHLQNWRRHPAQIEARRRDPYGREAGIVVIAHSMGGLVVQGLGSTEGGFDDVRTVATLGTPFWGAPKAMRVLAEGRGAPLPLPHGRLRDLARTLPGVYDLLPQYACVTEPGVVRKLASADVAAVGADADLAQAAQQRYAAGRNQIPYHHALVGTHQTTSQSLRIVDGELREEHGYFVCDASGEARRDGDGGFVSRSTKGDETVPFISATPYGHEATTFTAQTHGGLPKASEVIQGLRSRLLYDADLGPRLGAGDLGLKVPDVVEAGAEFTVTVTASDDDSDVPLDPGLVSGVITDVDSGIDVRGIQPARRRDGGPGLAQSLQLPAGLYRVAVEHAGGAPVSQIVLVGSS